MRRVAAALTWMALESSSTLHSSQRPTMGLVPHEGRLTSIFGTSKCCRVDRRRRLSVWYVCVRERHVHASCHERMGWDGLGQIDACLFVSLGWSCLFACVCV